MEKKIKIKELEIYVSKDGKEFDSQKECQEYEENLNLLNSIKKKPIELFVYESTDGEQFTSKSDCLMHQKVINKVSKLELLKQTCTSCKGEGNKDEYETVYEGYGSDGAGNWGSSNPTTPRKYEKYVGTKKCKTCAGKGYNYEFRYGSNGYQRYKNKLFTYDEINDLKI